MLPEILSQIDVFINPSLNESFSFTIREAMSAGIPVIARDAGAISEAFIGNEINGFLFKEDRGLIDCMKETLIHPSYRIPSPFRNFKTIGDDAREWIERYKRLLL